MINKDLARIFEFGRFTKARVKAIQLGQVAAYQVINPGRLNGKPILDETRTYQMDQIVRITAEINRKAGRGDHVRNWITVIDQE